jgi:hypothetical protein
MSEIDPVTNEPIVLQVRRRPPQSIGEIKDSWQSSSWLDWRSYGPLKPGWAFRPGVPIRSMAVAMVLAPVLAVLSSRAKEPFPIPLFLGYLVVIGVCIGLEHSNTRDYVTPTRLVRQSGILGRKRKEVPLGAIERVEFDYSGLWPSGEQWNMGDLRIFRSGEIITIANVPNPEAAAQTILDLKSKAVLETAGPFEGSLR